MLRLNPEDQHLLTSCLESLLSPLDYECSERWRLDASERLRRLMRADVASFFLPIDGKANAVCAQYPARVRGYSSYMSGDDGTDVFLKRQRRLRVADRELAWGPQFRKLRHSRYWSEFAMPLRLYSSLSICVPTGPEPVLEHSAQIIFNHDSPHHPGFTDREMALGRLILPALQAGVMTWLRLRDECHRLAVQIDDLDIAVALFDLDGACLHVNAAMDALLRPDVEGANVLSLGQQMARRLGKLNSDVALAAGVAKCTRDEIRTPQTRYRLTASRINGTVSKQSETILITVQREGKRLATAEALRTRFGLTARQAEVALLLAQRRTNSEMAELLCISPHTARHHTEAVMETLDVRDRRAVRARLMG